MKRTFLAIVLAIFCGNSMFAQDQQRQEFLDKLMASVNHCRELLYAGQHKEAIAPITDLIAFLDTTTIYKVEGIGINQDMLNEEKSMHQYDLACCYALLGQKKPALEALEQSVANGYNNYHNIINDKDLQSLHKDKRFQKLLQTIKENTKIEVLRKSNAYDFADMSEIPQFQYQTIDEKNLQRVREYFKLDTIPGKDDELTHIKNLLHFAHDNIRHNGSNMAICEFDAIDIYNYNRSTGNGVNCRQLALSLCDMYLSMGYKARVVTCLPADPNDYECHVINAVYSETLNKWLYIDPTMDAWVMDENGTMLSIAEVRERLINDQPLVLCETANWNHENPQSKEYYLETYMAKNLYYFVCKNRSCFNQESIYYDTQNEDVRLIPVGFVNDNFGKAATTTNPDIFWAKPQDDVKQNMK